MELQRILARDARSATDQALSRFGPDVFVISNQRVAGQTELMVAVDVAPCHPEDDDSVVNTHAAAVAPAASSTPERPMSFENALQAALDPTNQPQASKAPASSAVGDRDWIRSREIVAAVRQEIAALRQEFRLNQSATARGSLQHWPQELQPLVQGLSDAPVPASLRTLLLSGLREESSLSAALESLNQQLTCNVPQALLDAPAAGVHVLAGPSGGGKTMMIARLARQFLKHGRPDQIAVISFKDVRAGAWAQLQMLCAQLGVDAYRVKETEVIGLLQEELDQRTLLLIDTPGVQIAERLRELAEAIPEACMHMVVPADASTATLQRMLDDNPGRWTSLMVSKLDESSAPWAMLQILMEAKHPPGLSVGAKSDSLGDELVPLSAALLIDLALSRSFPRLYNEQPPPAPDGSASGQTAGQLAYD